MKKEKITLKNSEILAAFQGVDTVSSGVHTSSVSLIIYNNNKLLFAVVESIQKTQSKRIHEILPKEQYIDEPNGAVRIKPDFIASEEAKTFFKEDVEFLKSEQEIEIIKMNFADLKFEENKIPTYVLNQIYPLLNEIPE